ncbi:MAG: replicative helicase loader/inhibitor [Clostridia bacterium]
MSRQEIIQVLTLLAGNYESFAKRTETDEQVKIMISTWLECLGDLDYKLVLAAVKKSIINSPYPPTIHEIRKNAIEMSATSIQKNPVEAWNEALKMISKGIYMTEEEFNQHSPEIKSFFGSVNQVRQLAMVDVETINTVTKGQFLKQYETLVQNKKEERMLPKEMKKSLDVLVNKMDINKLEGEIGDKNNR